MKLSQIFYTKRKIQLWVSQWAPYDLIRKFLLLNFWLRSYVHWGSTSFVLKYILYFKIIQRSSNKKSLSPIVTEILVANTYWVVQVEANHSANVEGIIEAKSHRTKLHHQLPRYHRTNPIAIIILMVDQIIIKSACIQEAVIISTTVMVLVFSFIDQAPVAHHRRHRRHHQITHYLLVVNVSMHHRQQHCHVHRHIGIHVVAHHHVNLMMICRTIWN